MIERPGLVDGDSERVRIPGVVLDEELGRGASSIVYRARRDGVACAVKVGRDKRGARWFRREAAALARVTDPGLPAVIDVGESGGVPYLVMELVEGETLAARLTRERLDEREAIELCRALARILEAVHRRGLVHRDVKPRNIVLERGGRVRLVDFGFATVALAPQGAAGTRAYAAPEQLRVPAVIDGRADLYALGRVLYECLTGVRWPEVSSDPEQDVPPPLAAIIAGLVAAEPDRRYRTAGALLGDLERVERREPLLGPDAPASEPEPHALVGREHELSVLLDAWEEAGRGWGSAFLLRGERGGGKSRFLRELGRTLAERACVLSIECEQGDPTPLAGLSAMLVAIAAAARARGTDLASAIGPDLAPVAAALSPAMTELIDLDPVAPSVGADAFTELATELVARALVGLGPTVLSVDDAQWLDAGSAEVFARIAQRVRRLPVLLVVAGRGEATTLSFVGREALAGALHPLELTPFDAEQTAALVAAFLGARAEPGLVAWLARVADGTPLGLIEVLQATIDEGALSPRAGHFAFDREVAARMHLPRGALALLERRLRELPDATRRVFEAAAVVGRTFEHGLLAAVVGVMHDELEFALVEARRAGLIEALQEEGRFVHDSVREALLEGLEPLARRALHQRIAEALDRIGGADPYVLATHYAAGEPEQSPARVMEVCRAACERALAAFDNEGALRFFETARAAAVRAGVEVGAELLVGAAEAELRIGAHAESVALFEAALEGTQGAVARATILGRIAWAYQIQPNAEAAWAALARAFDAIGEVMPVETPVSAGRTALAFVESRLRARRSFEDPSDRATVELLCELHYQNARLGLEYGRPFRLLQSTLRAHALAARLGPSATLARMEAHYGAVSTLLGRREAGAKHLAAARAMAGRLAEPTVQAYATQLSALAACFAGDFDPALDHLRRLVDEQGHWLEVNELCINVFNAYLIEALRGRPREAWAWLEKGLGRVSRHGREVPGFAQLAHCMPAALAALTPHPSDAALRARLPLPFDFEAPLQGFLRTMTWGTRVRHFVERGEVGPELEALLEEFRAEKVDPRRAHPVLAEYYVAVVHGRIHQSLRAPAGERPRVAAKLRAAMAELRAIARYPLLRAHLRLAEGVELWLSGEPVKARAKLTEADELATDHMCPWVRFQVGRVHARMLRDQGRLDAARERARAAAHIARDHGAVHWARWIDEELGVRVRAPLRFGSTGSASGSALSTSRAQLKALLHVLRVGARQLGIDEQARVLVDEVLETVDADRALLLFEPEAHGAKVLTLGRTRSAETWAGASVRGLVERAQQSGIVQLPGVSDDGEADARAVAIPLWLRERTAGALYVERDPDRRGFATEELEILVALSYQVPVALELARTLRERDVLQDALAHAQKMEAVGRLAGGLAHDSNNMLMVVISALSLLEQRTDLDEDARGELEVIKDVVTRASDLTKQLLTFARRQARNREPLDLNAIIGDVVPMLRRLTPAHIDMFTDLSPLPVRALIDKGLCEQAIVNLALNARDAMPEGGTLRFASARVDLDEEAVRALPRLLAGPHVCLTVEDSGIGMPREVRESAFDPFFTTKSRGRGTGLGLSMVHAFVDQSEGAIQIESEPGRGTLLRLYFPAAPAEQPIASEPEPTEASRPPTVPPETARAETILVVEDEKYIRQVLEHVLTERGYTVLGAGEPREALELVGDAHIDLVISDVLMPGMSGPELGRAIRERSPDTKLLFISGYTDGELGDELGRGVSFLQKPFRSEEISALVRDLLAR